MSYHLAGFGDVIAQNVTTPSGTPVCPAGKSTTADGKPCVTDTPPSKDKSVLNVTVGNCQNKGLFPWPADGVTWAQAKAEAEKGNEPHLICVKGMPSDGKSCPSGFHLETADAKDDFCMEGPAKSKTMLYVGIGAGVLVLAGVIYCCMRKR